MGLFSRKPQFSAPPASSFRFVIEDTFLITARGPVFIGRIESGHVVQGQSAVLHLANGPRVSTVTSIQKRGRSTEFAESGEKVGITLDGLRASELPTLGGASERVLDSAALQGVQITNA